jgi:hypothetical protein
MQRRNTADWVVSMNCEAATHLAAMHGKKHSSKTMRQDSQMNMQKARHRLERLQRQQETSRDCAQVFEVWIGHLVGRIAKIFHEFLSCILRALPPVRRKKTNICARPRKELLDRFSVPACLLDDRMDQRRHECFGECCEIHERDRQ